MNFGQAIEALKQGKKVTRRGWNGNKIPPKVPPFPPYKPTQRVEYVPEYDLTYLLLNDGAIAVCDGCMYEKVNKHKWSNQQGYAAITDNNPKDKKTVKLHNYIVSAPEGFVIDHINGNRLDCRLINLRFATNQQNSQNKTKANNTTSKYRGVSYDSSRNKWISAIQTEGKTEHIGRFDIEEEAAKAYDKKALQYFGEFAKLNFPDEHKYPKMFLWLKPATTVKAEWCKDPVLKELVEQNGGEIPALGTICMFTAQKQILSGWLASQTDMLSEDWEEVC